MQQFANSLPRLADIVSSSRSARHSLDQLEPATVTRHQGPFRRPS